MILTTQSTSVVKAETIPQCGILFCNNLEVIGCLLPDIGAQQKDEVSNQNPAQQDSIKS